MPETVSPGPPTWQLFVDAIDKLPLLQQPSLLANLAIKLRRNGERDAARSLALRAWRQAKQVGDVSTLEVVHEALRVAVPRYHIQISTDEDRIAAWRTALAEVIRPDMLALEIGTGSGVLAMLAARAGADVVSCEHDSVMAAIAEEVIKRNGLLDRVRIVNKSSDALSIPADMPRAADILLLDLFANDLFQFEPFAIIQRARRLFAPGMIAVPRRVSLHATLANFARWRRVAPTQVAGFDLTPMSAIAHMRETVDAGETDLVVSSATQPVVSAELPNDLPDESGAKELSFISNGGSVNGVVVWLRLELTEKHVLEAKPGVARHGFYARPVFFAFPETLDTMPGQPIIVQFRWKGKSVTVTLVKQI